MVGCTSAPRYTDEEMPPREIISVNTRNESGQKNDQRPGNNRSFSNNPDSQSALKPQVGLAMFTGREHQGKQLASGELFDYQQLTAAHPTLPFNTIVTVTNMENDLFVRVRINDRGPNLPNRIINLSFEAARQLKMLEAGVAFVRIEISD